MPTESIHDVIVNLSNGPVQYEYVTTMEYPVVRKSIKMREHSFPYSITTHEFEFLKNIVVTHNLKTGYEIATGFGISSVAIGMGMKETGGKLVSMDAYIEEHLETPGYAHQQNEFRHLDADGYKSAKFLVDTFELENTVYLETGWSPTDTETVIKKHLSSPLDFVFIDGGHFPHQIIRDLKSIEHLLGERYVIALHDTYPHVYNTSVMQHIVRTFGKFPNVVVPESLGYNLSVIVNA